jgi:hypothetical protein
MREGLIRVYRSCPSQLLRSTTEGEPMRIIAVIVVLTIASMPGNTIAQAKQGPPSFDNARYPEDYSYARAFVIENEITGLAFPPMPDSMIVLGMGHAVSRIACARACLEPARCSWTGQRC